jgi:hypothetical protein
VGVLCLVGLGKAVANISPATPINPDTTARLKKQENGACRFQLKSMCSLGLAHNCEVVKILICEAE